ncbi:protein takeout [Tribolium castaneum]|uniref:Protein takeout-like Protein n=1 Tax=Tribolium castaneum TaxID=7070 RepID=D6X3K1_TRICA|nr:PREDICTED: protein takeout [Tribolium castaneum]EEZ97638.2 Protein takeout-like Protein [Tribolium castaneum]|eukprot:XP_967109.3 PREDICTED: protein takeout [Tribolium castaneum]
MKSSLILLIIFAVARSAKFPPNFKICNRKNPNLDECLKEAGFIGVRQATKDYPEIHLPNLNPLEVNEMKISAGSQGVVNVNQNFKNCKLYGVNTTSADTLQFDFEKNVAHVSGRIDELKVFCTYELNGKILLLPISGSGPSTVIIKKLKVKADYNFEQVKKKGKTYMHFTTFTVALEPGSVFFNFENLFNGDKKLGDNINKVLNENSKQVFDDVKEGYAQAFGSIVKQILNNLFAKVSIEEAFDQ